MPLGTALNACDYEYISLEEVKARLPMLVPIEGSGGVAEMYRYRGARGKIGFITPISSCFCEECNKLRLTSDGKLKTCLHSEQEIDLRAALEQGTEEALYSVIQKAIEGKEERHHLGEGSAPISRDMNKIGG
jgi:cyclic pyranopterin phosphate synthase